MRLNKILHAGPGCRTFVGTTSWAANAKAASRFAYIQRRRRSFSFVCFGSFRRDSQVSQRRLRGGVHGSECYMIRERVSNLAGALTPLIAVLRML